MLFAGWGMLESTVYFGMTLFSRTDQALINKNGTTFVAILTAGTILYLAINTIDKLKTRLLKALVFAVALWLMSAVDIAMFFIIYFLSSFVLGDIHHILYGRGIYGEPESGFTLMVGIAGLVIVVGVTTLYFIKLKRSGKTFPETIKSCAIFFYFMIFVTLPLTIQLLITGPAAFYSR